LHSQLALKLKPFTLGGNYLMSAMPKDIQQLALRPASWSSPSWSANPRLRYWAAVVALVAATVGHSMWATSLDSFTIDEPYHIAAGASYLRWHDYRVNPEHPPLVKLVVALAEPKSVLHLDDLQILTDKERERVYTQTAVFLKSDPEQVRHRARIAMMTFHAILLIVLAWLLKRAFSTGVALAALLLLALDPAVSAHLPVVMTDLPLALLGTICCCLAILCVRDGLWRDWLLFGLFAGLLAATKHSAPLIGLPLLIGCVIALAWQRAHRRPIGRQLAGLAATLALSMVVLWGMYHFQYYESSLKDARGVPVETFNRPLNAKINDLRETRLRAVLTVMTRTHVVPRAYIWGLADTLRAGVESRPFWINAFGHSYQGKAPWWVLFAILVVKLPIGFMLLAAGGIALLLTRQLPRETAFPLAAICCMATVFMAWLARNGVFYGGLRHFLFIVPLLAILGAVCIVYCLSQTQWWVRLLPVIAVAWIAIAVLPQRRIWEYHNGIAGGSEGAWEQFSNEGVDLGQRSGELIAFYKSHIAPAEPLLDYWVLVENAKAAGLKYWKPKPEEVASGNGYLTGWLCMRAPGLAERNWFWMPAMRGVKPEARFGNLFIYHGTFYLPKAAAGILGWRAFELTYLEKDGDKKLAEDFLLKAFALDPTEMSYPLELGNFAVGRKDRQKALEWYQLAWNNADTAPDARSDIGKQIARVKTLPEDQLTPMRNPMRE